MLCNSVNAAGISWMTRKLNALKMFADSLLDEIMWESVSGQKISHMAVRGLTCHTLSALLIYFIGIR
jgi:hypothetical protein